MTAASAGSIKIMRIITRLNIGGPAQHAIFLTERLNGGRFSSSLVAGSLSRGEGDMTILARRRGLTVTSVPALCNHSGIVAIIRAFLHLYWLIRRERPAVVHLHLLGARVLGGVAAKLAGVPLIIETLHGNLLQGYYRPAKAQLVLAVERALGRWAVDAVIALSDGQREDLVRHGIAERAKIHVVPLGLELNRFMAAPRDRGAVRRDLGIANGTFVVGAVGRFVPIKGYGVLLDAARQAAGALGQRLDVVLVGDGPLRNDLETQAERLGIRHLVRFLGWRDDTERLYAALDAVVLPSFNEGTPVSLIEAMAAGRPVIASRVGGIPDVVDDERSGLLVPPGDPAALAAAMLRMAGDPGLRQRLGDEGRRVVIARYGIDRLVSHLADLYPQLLAQKAPAAAGPDRVGEVTHA